MADIQQLQLEEFRRGLISRVADDQIPDNAFADCDNVELSAKFIPMSIKGHRKFNEESLADTPVMGGIVYKHEELGEVVVAACGGFLWHAPIEGGEFVKYQIANEGGFEDVTIDADSYPEMVQYNDELFIVNGMYPIITNAGHSTGKMLKISKETVVDFGDAERDMPEGLRYLCIHNERLFGACSLDDPNGLYWSEPYDPENWTPVFGLNIDKVGKDDGEIITGIATLNENYIYIFKTHNIYRYLTTGSNDEWSSNKVDTNYGAVAHRTIKLFEGNLVYLSVNGVASLNGNTVALIDENIQDLTTKINEANDNFVNRIYTKGRNFEDAYLRDGISTLEDKVKPFWNLFCGNNLIDGFVNINTQNLQIQNCINYNGELYFFGYGRYIYKFNETTKEFVLVYQVGGNGYGLETAKIASDGNLYIGSDSPIRINITGTFSVLNSVHFDDDFELLDNGYFLTIRNGAVYKFKPDPWEEILIDYSYNYHQLAVGSNGIVYLGGSNGIKKFNNTTNSIEQTNITLGSFDRSSAYPKTFNGNLYFFSYYGIYRLDASTGDFVKLIVTQDLIPDMQPGNIRGSIVINGTLYTYGNNILKLRQDGAFERISNRNGIDIREMNKSSDGYIYCYDSNSSKFYRWDETTDTFTETNIYGTGTYISSGILISSGKVCFVTRPGNTYNVFKLDKVPDNVPYEKHFDFDDRYEKISGNDITVNANNVVAMGSFPEYKNLENGAILNQFPVIGKMGQGNSGYRMTFDIRIAVMFPARVYVNAIQVMFAKIFNDNPGATYVFMKKRTGESRGQSSKINISNIGSTLNWYQFNFDNPIYFEKDTLEYIDFTGNTDTFNISLNSTECNFNTARGDINPLFPDQCSWAWRMSDQDDPPYEKTNIPGQFAIKIISMPTYYISREFDLAIDNPQKLLCDFLRNSETNYELKLTIASYDLAGKLWEQIPESDMQSCTITNETDNTIEFESLINKRYLKYKIEFLLGNVNVTAVRFYHQNPCTYESEPMRISTDNPIEWGIFDVDFELGTSEPTFYIRSGDNPTEILDASWVEVFDDEPIVGVDLRRYVQFKAVMLASSQNVIKSFSVSYTTNEKYVSPCAIVWKTKYILNMNAGDGIDNEIEYIYDKEGYWQKKSNEKNNIYFKGVNKMFGGSNETGIIRQKDFGYFNDTLEYESTFTTKKFRLTDIENLFRIIKIMYKSELPIKLAYSVDSEEFISVEIEANQKLTEIRETLAGIVRGQTIQIKVSWTANAITEIHKMDVLWEALRELNRR